MITNCVKKVYSGTLENMFAFWQILIVSQILKGSQSTTIKFCIAHLNSIPHHLSSQTKIKTIIFHIYGSMMTFHYGRKSEKNYKASKRANFNSDIPGEW